MSRTYFCRDVDDNFLELFITWRDTEQEEEGPLKKRRAHRGLVFFVLGQCVEDNMADHHIPLTHMVWIWGRMDCPDG